jgi:ureidoacrylate peracid hydrolase
MIVDMQYLDAHSDYGIGGIAKKRGYAKDFEWYFERLPGVIRNQRRLIRICRTKGIEVVFAKIGSLTRDGRDTSYVHAVTWPFVTPVGSKEAQILDDIRPSEDEIVINKTTSSVFNSQFNTDVILRNMGIRLLMICGVTTNGCVESTVRDACDLGYDVMTISDACLAYSEFQHEFALLEQSMFYTRLRRTDEILEEISHLAHAKSKSKLTFSNMSLPRASRKSRLRNGTS